MPFYGYRRIKLELKRRGFNVGRSKILRIKKELNLRTFYPEPKTSLPSKGHYKKPYLLVCPPADKLSASLGYVLFFVRHVGGQNVCVGLCGSSEHSERVANFYPGR
jgi:hypothetical protein